MAGLLIVFCNDLMKPRIQAILNDSSASSEEITFAKSDDTLNLDISLFSHD